MDPVLKLVTDALSKNPATAADALAVWTECEIALKNYLINNLPSLEEKALCLEKLLVKKIVGCFPK